MQAGVLNTIFTRMDLPFATQLHCIRPPDSLLPGIEYSADMTFLIMTTVWSLLKSVLPPNGVPVSLKETVTSTCCGLWYVSHTRKEMERTGFGNIYSQTKFPHAGVWHTRSSVKYIAANIEVIV